MYLGCAAHSTGTQVGSLTTKNVQQTESVRETTKLIKSNMFNFACVVRMRVQQIRV